MWSPDMREKGNDETKNLKMDSCTAMESRALLSGNTLPYTTANREPSDENAASLTGSSRK